MNFFACMSFEHSSLCCVSRSKVRCNYTILLVPSVSPSLQFQDISCTRLILKEALIDFRFCPFLLLLFSLLPYTLSFSSLVALKTEHLIRFHLAKRKGCLPSAKQYRDKDSFCLCNPLAASSKFIWEPQFYAFSTKFNVFCSCAQFSALN